MNQHFNQSAFEAERGKTFSGLPNIPALNELRTRPQWVAWHYLERDGNVTKPPVNPRNGRGASHSDPATWGTYEEAAAFALKHGLPGVGYVLTDDDDITGADLDDCIDEFDTIDDWARKIAEHAETYTEISPSGRGLRLIWRGKIDKTIKCDPARVEVYRHKRYLTITGNHLTGTPQEIRPAPLTERALQARAEQFKPAPQPAPEMPPHKPNGIISAALAQLSPNSGGDFFRSVNTTALQNSSRWVPDLFGSTAELQPGTGAWRVSSRNLGRNLQEDLSIAPSGIVDFGVADQGDPRLGKRTPIDLVLEHGGKRNATEAALWLCDRCGVDPARLGWRGAGERKQDAGAPGVGYATETINPDASVNEAKDWIMKKLLAKGEHSRWVAPPKMMKSALLASVANHLGAGVNFRGFKVKRKIGVLYCALERPGLTRRRLVAEQKLMNWSGLPIELCRTRFSLASEADAKRLIATINEASEKLKHLVECVIIDTSAKLVAAHGGDEQQAKDNGLVWGYLSDVREATGVHTAVVGHTGKNVARGERGSNASLGDADVVISIDGDGAIKTVTVTDANDLAEGELFSFTGKKYSFGVDEDGDEDSVYIVDSDPLFGEPVKAKAADQQLLGKGALAFKDALSEALIVSGADHRVRDNGPVVRAVGLEHVEAEFMKRYVVTGKGGEDPEGARAKAFERAVDSALRARRIGSEVKGRKQLIWSLGY
jgi:hypothetical protein